MFMIFAQFYHHSTVEPIWTETQKHSIEKIDHCVSEENTQPVEHNIELSLPGIDMERYLVEREDKEPASPRTISRRSVLRVLHCSLIRQERQYFLCRWGC